MRGNLDNLNMNCILNDIMELILLFLDLKIIKLCARMSLFLDIGVSQVALVVKNPPANAGDTGDVGSIPSQGRLLRVGNSNLLQYFLPGKFRGQRSLVGYIVHGATESNTPECTHAHTHTIMCAICV